MNNLKRILSLALASVMVMGMMVTGASAAKFSDSEDITHTAAVDVAYALGIINGMDDGSFNPNGDVTRAQMAKLIAFAYYGGDPKPGKPATATFADSASHWALEYIEYCANLGFIAGRSATEFDPEGKVTAAEAAKMMLVALGFDAETFKLVGANWSKNTMTLAQNLRVGTDAKNAKTLNLFGGLNVGANTPLTRDQAAQLIYNGIQANTVQMALTGVTGGSLEDILGAITGNSPKYDLSVNGPSLLTSKFGATVVEGVLDTASIKVEKGELTGTYKLVTYGVDEDGKSTKTDKGTYTTDIDASELFQQNVRLIYVGSGKARNVLAITSASDDVVSEGAWGALDMTVTVTEDDKKVKTVTALDGYAVAGDNAATLPVYSTETLAAADSKNITNWGAFCDEYKLIDNDHDGAIDAVLVTPVTLATVKSMNSKTMVLGNLEGGTTTITLATDEIEAGLAKGDYVTVTTNAAKVNTVKAANTLTAKVDASRISKDDTPITTLRVDGKWYTVADCFISADSSIKTNAAALNNHECDLVLVAGFIVAGAPVGEVAELSDAVMVVKVATSTGKVPVTVDTSADDYLQIRVLKADKTTAVLNVTSIFHPENVVTDKDVKVTADGVDPIKPWDG
ncbi:MAG: S-layer homology domain-containing protein, partial [Oscillospiraceae bacterium]|nr:S-layer homology domain-containing protein [Oscillospiraceae bacterium]